jgi:hypothetical protein
MSSPLRLTEDGLRTHLTAVEKLLTASAGRDLRLAPGWEQRPLVAGLVGDACELVERNRGAPSWVAPIMQLKSSVWAWLGYREEWAEEKRGAKHLSFNLSSLTIHFGARNNVYKPQIFRAEWAGLSWNGTEFRQLPEKAGHPHWQFDGMESFGAEEEDAAAELLAVLKLEENEGEAKEFTPDNLSRSDLRSLVALQEISRVHFPSAACWWKVKPDDAHAHRPKNVQELRKWLTCTLKYVADELSRLR